TPTAFGWPSVRKRADRSGPTPSEHAREHETDEAEARDARRRVRGTASAAAVTLRGLGLRTHGLLRADARDVDDLRRLVRIVRRHRDVRPFRPLRRWRELDVEIVLALCARDFLGARDHELRIRALEVERCRHLTGVVDRDFVAPRRPDRHLTEIQRL